MAINRAEYPITVDEAVRVLSRLADSISNPETGLLAVGDTRPEVIMWAVRRLQETESLDD